MIDSLINLANHLDELSFKKEADTVDFIIKRAFLANPLTIEIIIVSAPVVESAAISGWVWLAGVLGVGAAAGGAYYYSQDEEEARAALELIEDLYNKDMWQQRPRERDAGTDIDGDLDTDTDDYTNWLYSGSDDSAEEQFQNLQVWYDYNRGWVNKALKRESGTVIPFPSPESSIDEHSEPGYSLDSEYEEEDDEDTSPLDCHFLCWAEQIKGSGGQFSYHFMYNYTDMTSVVRDVLSKAILVQDYNLIKEILLPLELGRDDGILSPIHPSAFRASFKVSPLERAVCALCPGESYNIVYLSDTHKPKKTTEYDYNNKLLNMSEERIHNIYFDPILIKSSFPIMGTCKPTDGLRLVR